MEAHAHLDYVCGAAGIHGATRRCQTASENPGADEARRRSVFANMTSATRRGVRGARAIASCVFGSSEIGRESKQKKDAD